MYVQLKIILLRGVLSNMILLPNCHFLKIKVKVKNRNLLQKSVLRLILLIAVLKRGLTYFLLNSVKISKY